MKACILPISASHMLLWLAASSSVGAASSKSSRAACGSDGQEACSDVKLESMQSDQVLLQVKPALLESGAGHSSGSRAAANESWPTRPSMRAVLSGAACVASPAVFRRRRNKFDACTCRRRSSGAWQEARTSGWRCEGARMVPSNAARPSPPADPPQPPPQQQLQRPSDKEVGRNGVCSACLCVFDIDRTLTGKQADVARCPRNRELPLYDAGYGGGNATLSALSVAGISSTFCNRCHLGITSAGHGSGEHSRWNRYILDHVMRGEAHDAFTAAHPESQRWSRSSQVRSPYVIGQANKVKQQAVELIRRWFGAPGRNVCIRPQNVFFFGDRTENIQPFRSRRFNSREISCSSRDANHHHGGIGYCGATPEEIKMENGNILCASSRHGGR